MIMVLIQQIGIHVKNFFPYFLSCWLIQKGQG